MDMGTVRTHSTCNLLCMQSEMIYEGIGNEPTIYNYILSLMQYSNQIINLQAPGVKDKLYVR